MNKKAPLPRWTLYADPPSCIFIAEFLKNAGLQQRIALEQAKDMENAIRAEALDATPLIFREPVRLGELLDALFQEKPQKAKNNNLLDHKTFRLDRTLGTLSLKKSPEQPEIRLTEKEVALIDYLYTHQDRIVTRKELLAAVWDYAESVETHTLETHIYRLRQKIETDPSDPQILCTDENGYILKE